MLSIVVATRNDGHGDLLPERTDTFLDTLATLAARHEVPIELLMIEWNPPDWALPLRDVLHFPQGEWMKSRVITVPRELHMTLANAGVLEFYQMIAKNVGIRRATHDWILCTNPDVIFSHEVWDKFSTLRPNADHWYRAVRHDLDVKQVPAGTIDDTLAFCQRRTAAVHANLWNGISTEACGDFTLLHRTGWSQTRGYPEVPRWSIHIDSLFLVQCLTWGMTEQMLKGPVYHINHEGSWTVDPQWIKRFPHIELGHVEAVLRLNELGVLKNAVWNGPDWGFGNETLEEWTC